MILTTIFLYIIAFAVVIRKYNAISPLFFFLLFNFFQLISYYLLINKIYDETTLVSAVPIQYVGYNILETSLVYSFLSLAIIVNSYIFYRPKNETIPKFSFANILKAKVETVYIDIAATLFFIWLLTHALSVNWYLVFEYTQYLALSNHKILGTTNIPASLFNSFLYYIFIFSLTLYHIAKLNNLNYSRYIFLIIFIYALIFIFARGSRFIALAIIYYFLLNDIIKGKKTSLVKYIIIFLTSTFFLQFALVYRGNETLGLSQMIPVLQNIYRGNLVTDLTHLYFNVTLGVTIFDVSMLDRPFYSTKYIILSNLPTPSFLDGFKDLAEVNDYRFMLTKFVPYNSFVESFSFGYFFFIYYVGLLTAMLALISNRMQSSKYIYYLPCYFFSFLTIFYASQYSVRTVTKGLWIEFLLVFLIDKFLSTSDKPS